MDELQKLQEKRAGILAEMRALSDLAVGAGRGHTTEEDDKLKQLRGKKDAVEASIAIVKEQNENAKPAEQPAAPPAPASQPGEVQNRSGVPIVTRPDPRDEKPFENFGQQVRAIIDFARTGKRDERLDKVHNIAQQHRAATGMGENVPADGGFIVQKDFADGIMARSYDTGKLVSMVRKIPISANSNGLEIPAIDEQSRATGSRFGGVQSYWGNEADTITATKAKFRKIKLELKKLMGAYYASDEVLQDSVALGSIIETAFSEEFGFMLDDAILNGVGGGQMYGILTSPALVSVAKESGQASATINFQNVIKQRSRLWTRSLANAVYLCNPDVPVQLAQMTVGGGTSSPGIYLPAGGVSADPYDRLLGRPLMPIEQCPALGTVGDLLLVDLSQYVMIDKGGLQSASSIHVRFLNDEQVFRFTYRVDGAPLWHTALTPYKTSNTVSPYVALATR